MAERRRRGVAARAGSMMLLLLLLLARDARAGDTVLPFVSPGPVYSVAPAEGRDGLGIEVSAGAVLARSGTLTLAPHVGALYRGQHYAGGGASFARYTAAAEAGVSFAGVEAGWGWRDRGGDVRGLHLSPYLTLAGALYLGPQVLLPVDGGAVTWELNVGLKPVPLLVLLGLTTSKFRLF